MNEGFIRETTQQAVHRVNWRAEEEAAGQGSGLVLSLVRRKPPGADGGGFEVLFAYEDGSMKVFDGRRWEEILPHRAG